MSMPTVDGPTSFEEAYFADVLTLTQMLLSDEPQALVSELSEAFEARSVDPNSVTFDIFTEHAAVWNVSAALRVLQLAADAAAVAYIYRQQDPDGHGAGVSRELVAEVLSNPPLTLEIIESSVGSWGGKIQGFFKDPRSVTVVLAYATVALTVLAILLPAGAIVVGVAEVGLATMGAYAATRDFVQGRRDAHFKSIGIAPQDVRYTANAAAEAKFDEEPHVVLLQVTGAQDAIAQFVSALPNEVEEVDSVDMGPRGIVMVSLHKGGNVGLFAAAAEKYAVAVEEYRGGRWKL